MSAYESLRGLGVTLPAPAAAFGSCVEIELIAELPAGEAKETLVDQPRGA